MIQADIISKLEDQNGGMSHDLTSEEFDNFPVVSVDSYRQHKKQHIPWLLSSTGIGVICVVVLVIIACAIGSVIVCLKKKKRNSV